MIMDICTYIYIYIYIDAIVDKSDLVIRRNLYDYVTHAETCGLWGHSEVTKMHPICLSIYIYIYYGENIYIYIHTQISR